MDVDFDYGLLEDVDAYLRATPRETPNASKAVPTNGRVSALDDSANGVRRGNTGQTPAGFDFGNHGFGNLSDMGYLHSPNTSSTNKGGTKGFASSKRDDDLRLPVISGVTPSGSISPTLTNHTHNPNSNRNNRATAYGNNNVTASADRARSYEPPSNHRNGGTGHNQSNVASSSTGVTANAGLNGYNRTSGGGAERRFSTAPNGRVSPLRNVNNHAGREVSEDTLNDTVVTTESVRSGWVKEQARRLNEEIRRNSPVALDTPMSRAVPITGGSANHKPKLPAGWVAGGYDLGLDLDSLSDITSTRGAASGFPSSPMNARKPATTATSPSSNGPKMQTPQPPQYGATAVAPYQRNKTATTTTTTATTKSNTPSGTRPHTKIRINGAGEVVSRDSTPGTTAKQAAPSTGATRRTAAPSNKADDFQQMPKATAAPRVPPWRVQQQQLTSRDGSSAGTSTSTSPRKTVNGSAAPVAPNGRGVGSATTTRSSTPQHNTFTVTTTTGKSEPLYNNVNGAVVPPSTNTMTAASGAGLDSTMTNSNPTTPSHPRKIKMEAVNTSAVPSILGSFMGQGAAGPNTNSADANVSAAADAFQGLTPAGTMNALIPPTNSFQQHLVPFPLASPGSARAYVTMPYDAAERKHMDAWQTNFQLLSYNPKPLYNARMVAEHARTSQKPQATRVQWYPRVEKVPVELAGESVELDEKTHNVFTLMRQRKRPLNVEYPAVFPMPLDTRKLKHCPRTPFSFYGPPRPHVGKDWFKDALADATEVPSPDLASLDKIDGDKKTRGVRR